MDTNRAGQLVLCLTCIAVVGLLCAGAAMRATTTASSAAGGNFSVKTFGAAGDGKVNDTPAINRTIEAASKAGGGTVHFPPGDYLSTSIHLASHVTLELALGATIIAAGRQSGLAYDAPEPNPFAGFQDFGHGHWHDSLIWGDGLSDIAIVGQGTLRGDGLVRGHTRPDDPADKAIALKRCRRVRLSGITILHGGHVAILASGTDDLTIDHVLIDTNRDGIDIDCCHNVRLTDCRVNAPRDDGICFKSSYALGEVRATENVAMTGCTLSGYDEGTVADGSYRKATTGPTTATTMTSAPRRPQIPNGRLKFGTESNGGLKHMRVTDCHFEHCAGLAFETVDGGDIDDIRINDCDMRDISTSPLFLRLGARLRGPGPRSVVLMADGNLSPAAAAERAYQRASQEASARAAATSRATTRNTSLSPGTPGEGRGGGTRASNPLPNPPPEYRGKELDSRFEHAGTLRRVVVSNLTVTDAMAREGIVLSGIPGHAIEQVTLRHIRIDYAGGGGRALASIRPPELEAGYPEPGMFGLLPAYGLFARHVRGLKCEDVGMTCRREDARPAFVLEDVSGATFVNVRADHPVRTPVMILNGTARSEF